MSLNNAGQFRANGTVAPSRFVKIDTTGDNLVIQTTGNTDPQIGISQVGMKRTPGVAGSDPTVAAAAGDPLDIFSLGDVAPLQLGGTVTRGDFLTSDASGQGITATAGQECGARALQSGVSGNLVLVQIVSRLR